MKIKLTTEAKRFITLSEQDAIKAMAKDFSHDNFKDEAQTAARIAGGNNSYEILKIEAEFAHNCRIYDRYCENSGLLDIWINVYAFNAYAGFYLIGAYLSDIWESTGDNADQLRERMYIKKFKAE